MTSKLAAELEKAIRQLEAKSQSFEKMQETVQQLEAKLQAQDNRQEEASAIGQQDSTTSEDSESSEHDDDSETSNVAVPPWLKTDGEPREQGVNRPTEEPQPVKSDTEKDLRSILDSRDDRVRELEEELKRLRVGAQSYEKRVEIHKLRADMAEEKLKQLRK